MQVAEAMSLAAEQGCDLHWDEAEQRWTVRAIGYDADACSLTAEELLRIDGSSFVARYIPDRP